MGFKENLKSELEYQGLKTQELSDKSGVKKRTIDHYLISNPQEPSVTNAFKIAKALNVSVEYLMTGSELHENIPLTKELIDFLNCYLSLTPRQRAVIKDMVAVLQG